MKVFVLFLMSLLWASCASEHKEIPRPNIVWITSEDNSKHYLKLFDENGVETPNIEKLASSGIIFTRAFSNGPVCSVARSTLISGSYAPRIGAQFHRKLSKVPMPDSLKMFPTYLREVGYYTTNNRKEDYNIFKSEDVWDESSKDASWRNRGENQPFFHVFNIGVSHESSLHFSEEKMNNNSTATDLKTVNVFPNHPQTDFFRYTNALYRDKIVEMDRQVGVVIAELEKDSLLDDTFIFYYGDHGGVLPGSKGYVYETGVHVPLVVHIPKNYKHLVDSNIGNETSGFVSFIDFGPTVLNLAGVEVPEGLDGKPFLGPNVSADDLKSKNLTFSYADRFDEKYDMVRAVRKGNFKYIRNYQPFNFDGLMNNYRYKQLAYQEWAELYKKGELNEIQSTFFKTRKPEMLFDLEKDPYETINLVGNPAYQSELLELRKELKDWVIEMPDLSFYPEYYLLENALENPVKFGKDHKKMIQKYAQIADLSLGNFDIVKSNLVAYLSSEDPFERYWAIIACSSFGKKAISLEPKIRIAAKTDTLSINRVRAAEYLGLVGIENPSKVMLDALYKSENPGEALLILNSITLMKTMDNGYDFNIDFGKIPKQIADDTEVKRRLEFLRN